MRQLSTVKVFMKKAIVLQDPIQSLSLYMVNKLGNETSNLIVSPYSLFATLLMAASTFDESARNQILESLKMNVNIDVKDFLTSLRKLIQIIEKETPTGVVKGANSIWPNKSFFKELSFYQPLIEYLGVEVKPVVFPQPGCDMINARISEITNGLIQNLLDPNSLSQRTSSVITNAIYFNSKWAKPFKSTSTIEGSFNRFSGNLARTNFMCQTADFFYASDSQAQVLSMDYTNNFSFVIFLPRNKDLNSFRELKQSLGNQKYQAYIDMLGVKRVAVKMPKFKHTWGTASLKEMLMSLGISRIFEEDENSRKVDDVVQKAVIDIDEERTEAAAAVVVMLYRSVPQPCEQFIADHPFIYFLRHSNETILFAGEYIMPE